ncbi:MAG: PASTA domain-containing protein, partial [Oscillospiraceae bacterium]|jgi:stage V sporulation protein D (sporulation-specific penicillin-binding protein)|nr:PASTA domain-containing protein [Oscillospiraceae bacterium]
MAAPVVGKILSEALPYLGVAPQYEDAELMPVYVPNAVGESVDNAKSALAGLHLAHKIVGDGGTVTAQLPAANASVDPGTKVIIYTGEAKPDTLTVKTPNLKGKSYDSAKAELEAAGMFMRAVGAPTTLASARVSMQSVPAGEEISYGSVIEVTLVDTAIQGEY